MAKNSRTRVIRTAQNSKSSLLLQDTSVSIIGDERHFIVVDDKGITIKGPISFITDATGRRNGALFVGLNDFLETIPQTIVTPHPSKIPFPPVSGLVNMAKDLAFFLSLLV